MLAYDAVNPPCDHWEEYGKPQFIQNKIQEICRNIGSKGEKTYFNDIFDYLYEYIEDNLGKFLDEDDYGTE